MTEVVCANPEDSIRESISPIEALANIAELVIYWYWVGIYEGNGNLIFQDREQCWHEIGLYHGSATGPDNKISDWLSCSSNLNAKVNSLKELENNRSKESLDDIRVCILGALTIVSDTQFKQYMDGKTYADMREIFGAMKDQEQVRQVLTRAARFEILNAPKS